MQKCLKLQSCLKMWFSTTVDKMWYAIVAIYAKNLLPSNSIVSWWCFVNDTGEVVKENWQKVTSWVKNAIMQVKYFLNGPMFNLLFYWEKVTSYEKISNKSPAKSKTSKKF